MARDFVLPVLGSGLKEAEIAAWHVEVGDRVSEGQIICDVETEKSVIELPAPFDGVVVEIVGPVGTSVYVGNVLARIGDATEGSEGAARSPVPAPGSTVPAEPSAPDATTATAAQGPMQSGEGQTSAPPPGEGDANGELAMAAAARTRGLATPLARRMARQNGIDLTAVVGSGLGGRICRKDLEQAIAAKDAAASEPTEDVAAVPEQPSQRTSERVRLSRLRRTIAEHMTSQWQTVPHITGHADADASRLLAARQALSERFNRKVPFDALLIAASVPALRSFPEMNATFDGEELVLHRRYDVGFAVGTKDGLVVPVVRDADHLSLQELADIVSSLSERALSRTLSPAEQGQQTFTVSNVGPVGADHVTQILPRGTTAIASFGRARRQPVARGDEIAIVPVMPVSGTFDHRAVDGGPGMGFLHAIIDCIEEPALLHA
jgi:pyruvate/2-oxoglutarate dehydrogenase complex dihydrolipoamide acyltransferase (E2) component